MSKIRKALVAATLMAVPLAVPVVAATAASAETGVPTPGVSLPVNETDGFWSVYRSCRGFGGGVGGCLSMAWEYRNIN